MQLFLLNNLRPKTGATKRRKIVGRGTGSSKGNTSGRGNKGQKCRAGYKIPTLFEGGQTRLARKIPKRGMGAKQIHHGGVKYFVINTDHASELARRLNKTELTVEDILSEQPKSKKYKLVKVIRGTGTPANIKIAAHKATKGAKAAVNIELVG